ncbi:hypothetical protein [Ruminococcus callidus]|uniref:hypothetical protein n=1 Tax=Ruminococcus callidus TaxID=40519 RepID=UPI0035211B6F
MKIQYNGSSKILKRLVELVNRSQNVALRQDNTDKNTLYWTGLDGVEITVNIPSGAVEVDTELSETSTNPVENQAITKELAQKADKSVIPTVGDGVLSVQRNGKSVGTFSANAAKDTAVNISVPEKVSELENDAGYGTYTKPAAGIPKSDLASGVQASLGKADTALQKHQDISGKVDNTAAGADSLLSKITNSWTATPTDNTYFIRQDTSSKNEFGRVKFSTLWSYIKSKVESLGYTKNTGTITGIKMNGASKGTSGVVDLGTVITAHQDISGKQDKSTAVTHTANTAVGSTAKPVYIAADGKATPITHSVNSDVPSNAKFTDTTYSDATQSTHGLMTAADKKKLDGIAAGATKVAVDSALSATSTNPVQNKAVKAALDSKSASGHTHAMITNSMLNIGGANNAAKWVCLGTLVSGGDARSALIRVWSGNGFNAGAYQNASFEIQIKDGYQSTPSADRACGVTVYRINCSTAKVKVIPTKHNTYTVWVYLPWAYWNGNYAVYGRYTSWTYNGSNQTAEPEGTAADTAYYDQAFLTSTVAAAKTLTDSGWVAMTVEGYAKSGTVKYRTYGKQITITGSAVLKNDIATSYPAPQYIASTTFDFSKIVGCSGVGRSSSGVGAYVAVENYNGDNLVSVYALGSKIAAGSTLYFTITGFID